MIPPIRYADSGDLQVHDSVARREVELVGDDVGGIAVAIAARLPSLARSDEVVVSSSVKDLVVPDRWHVFAALPA